LSSLFSGTTSMYTAPSGRKITLPSAAPCICGRWRAVDGVGMGMAAWYVGGGGDDGCGQERERRQR
jgi:hypothetical protein